MTLSEAIKKSVQAYYDGDDMPELNKNSGARKYDKKYLDDFEKKVLGDRYKPEDEEDE